MHIDRYKVGDEGPWNYMYPDADGCSYEDAVNLIQVGILGFCGCGVPGMNLAFVRDGLAHIDQKFDGDVFKERDAWHAFWNAKKADEKRIFGSEAAAYFFYYWASKEDLTEHGGSVPGWLSDKGREVLDDLRELTRLEEIPATYGEAA
jgi:hypothetical protein